MFLIILVFGHGAVDADGGHEVVRQSPRENPLRLAQLDEMGECREKVSLSFFQPGFIDFVPLLKSINDQNGLLLLSSTT